MQFGSTIIHLTSVDSTNNYAAKLVKEGMLSSGTVILADLQTAGKGQRGAVWESSSGLNLLFSLVIKQVNLSVNDQFLLNQLTSLAIYDFLGKFGISADVKWPNDIYVGDKKIAGILVESHISGSMIKDVIIGVGLNVNEWHFDEMRATSMRLQLNQVFSVRMLLNELLKQLNFWWQITTDFEKETIRATYLEKMLGFRQWRRFEAAGRIIDGKIEGVDEWGRLLLTSNDELNVYDIKEITYCW